VTWKAPRRLRSRSRFQSGEEKKTGLLLGIAALAVLAVGGGYFAFTSSMAPPPPPPKPQLKAGAKPTAKAPRLDRPPSRARRPPIP